MYEVRVQFTVTLKNKEKKECMKAMTMLYPWYVTVRHAPLEKSL